MKDRFLRLFVLDLVIYRPFPNKAPRRMVYVWMRRYDNDRALEGDSVAFTYVKHVWGEDHVQSCVAGPHL